MQADAPSGIIGLGLMGTTQAGLLCTAIALRGGESDSAAIIEAIRPSCIRP
jgi:hypothetical protein